MHQPTSSARRSDGKHQPAGARIRSVWLVLARAGSMGIAALALIIWGLGVPVPYAQLGTVCTAVAAACGDQQPTPASVQAFHEAGMSIGFYAAYTGTVEVLFALLCLTLSALLFLRKSDTPVGLLTALFLATFAPTQTSATALASANPIWAGPVNLLQPLSYFCLALFLYLFPDGHFVPRWTRFLVPGWILLLLLGSGLLPPKIFVRLLFGVLVISLAAQVYRYRRVSTPVQRQQTKWVVVGVVAAVLGSVCIIGGVNLLSMSDVPGTWRFLVGNTMVYLFSSLVPLSIAVAILRSRLWDIDVIINRALVYGSLTALLAALYFALVIGAQALAQALTGRRSLPAWVVVASTLLIAALFQPLRARLQAGIDRRFYWRKYDAAAALAAFGAALRGELDLAQLDERLVSVVSETMQPEHTSLWLREPAPVRDARDLAAPPRLPEEGGALPPLAHE